MNFFYRLFPPKEIKTVFRLLDEAERVFKNPVFTIIRNDIERMIHKNPGDFVQIIKENQPARRWMYKTISQLSGDRLVSGEYYPDNDISPADCAGDLGRLFNASTDKLVEMGVMTQHEADEEKREILKLFR